MYLNDHRMFACRTTVLLWSGACCCNRNSPNDLLYCSQSRSADKMKFKFCRNDRLTFPCRTTVLPWSSARCGKRNSWNGLLHYSHSRSTEKIKLNFWTKKFMLGRGARWYLVSILQRCPSSNDYTKEGDSPAEKGLWESVYWTMPDYGEGIRTIKHSRDERWGSGWSIKALVSKLANTRINEFMNA